MLQRGNATFAGLGQSRDDESRFVIPVSAEDLGLAASPGLAPQQTPVAAVLGCADARVPLELVFSQAANEVFAVRVAGNVLDGGCVGSIDFALARLPTVRLVAVVGHTGCGAVTAAVEAYLEPDKYVGLSANLPLRGIVDAVMAAVRGADIAMRARHGEVVVAAPGYQEALIDSAVVFNAAVAGHALRRIFSSRLGDELGVVFGVYDLASRRVGLPATDPTVGHWVPGLSSPPAEEAMIGFAETIVDSDYIATLLAGPAG